MDSKPPQTRKGTHGFPFQTLPHSAGNGREKSGAGAPACSKPANDLFSLSVYLKKEVQNLLFSGMMIGRKVRDAA